MKSILNKIFKIISSIIFVILLLIIIGIIAYVVRINYLASQDRLGEIKTNFYTILTQSMHPTIKAGDIVVTYRNDDNIYEEKDIITFISEANGNIIITHRVEEVYEKEGNYSYKTKGDNNNTSDNEIIPSHNVLGKVTFKIPKAGYIQQFLVSKTGWIIAVLLPSLGIIIYDVLKIFKRAYKKNDLIDEESEEVKKRKENLEEVMKPDEFLEVTPASSIDSKLEEPQIDSKVEQLHLAQNMHEISKEYENTTSEIESDVLNHKSSEVIPQEAVASSPVVDNEDESEIELL